MKLRTAAALILTGVAVIFLTIFFATIGFVTFVSQQISMRIDAVALSQIIVGIAEVIIACAIGAEVAIEGSDFLLSVRTSITVT